MALPSTIPTSFVPRAQNDPIRPRKSGKNIFLIVSLGLFVITIVASGGVFAYQRYLTSVRDEKAAELVIAQKNINTNTVQEFVRLQNRIQGTKTILDNHVELSQFFDLLESKTLQTVRYDTLSIVVADDRTAKVQMTGVAKTFNSLAAQSSELAKNPKIKRAIFSGFKIQKDNSVSFSLDFDLDKSLVEAPSLVGTAAAVTTPASVGTSTPLTGSTSSVLAGATTTAPKATSTAPTTSGTKPATPVAPVTKPVTPTTPATTTKP